MHRGDAGCDEANPDEPCLTMTVDDYVAEVNRQTFAMIQLESPETVEKDNEACLCGHSPMKRMGLPTN